MSGQFYDKVSYTHHWGIETAMIIVPFTGYKLAQCSKCVFIDVLCVFYYKQQIHRCQ